MKYLISALTIIASAGVMMLASESIAGTKMESPDDTYIENAMCDGSTVVMEANSRTTSTPTIYFLGKNSEQKKKIELESNICYGYLTCVNYNKQNHIAVLSDSACGGNAVEPDYILINTKTYSKIKLNSATARNIESKVIQSRNSATSSSQSGADPKKIADKLQIAGVSRCIAAATVMSAGLVSSPNVKSDGPEIRNNNSLMQFYGAARTHLLQSMNNPGAVGAIDNMVRQQGDYFGNIIKFQGWGSFMPEYKRCQDNTR